MERTRAYPALTLVARKREGATVELGKLVRVDPREVWAHEAHDMTPWLLDNADVLADVLGIDLELSDAEHPVGAFALDLIGRDLTHDCVLIIENQLTPTDHGHLGQLITYAAGTDAGTVVWVAPAFREEHRQALDLLNSLGGDRVRFFGVQLGVVRIGDSAAAPLMELQAQPNDWAAQVLANVREVSRGAGKTAAYAEFWTAMLERIRAEHPGWTRARRPGGDNWLSLGKAFRGAGYTLVFPRGRIRCELYIDDPDPERVKTVFAALHDRRAEIEGIFGGELSWQELPERHASRVAADADGDISQSDRHLEFVEWFVDTHGRLRRAIDTVLPAVLADIEHAQPADG